MALHNKTGLPRILENEVGGRIPTFNLTCDCASFIGAGLPCEGMLAVCRSTGSILSYKVFHSHWFSSSIRKPLPGHATFDTNERLKLDEDVIIGHQEREEPPSRLDNDIPPPKKAKVVQDAQKTRLVGLRDTRKGSSRGAKAVARITEAGEDVHNIDLGDVETGKGKSKSKRSRRFRKASGGKRNIKLATKPNQKNHSQQPNAVKMSKKRK